MLATPDADTHKHSWKCWCVPSSLTQLIDGDANYTTWLERCTGVQQITSYKNRKTHAVAGVTVSTDTFMTMLSKYGIEHEVVIGAVRKVNSDYRHGVAEYDKANSVLAESREYKSLIKHLCKLELAVGSYYMTRNRHAYAMQIVEGVDAVYDYAKGDYDDGHKDWIVKRCTHTAWITENNSTPKPLFFGKGYYAPNYLTARLRENVKAKVLSAFLIKSPCRDFAELSKCEVSERQRNDVETAEKRKVELKRLAKRRKSALQSALWDARIDDCFCNTERYNYRESAYISFSNIKKWVDDSQSVIIRGDKKYTLHNYAHRKSEYKRWLAIKADVAMQVGAA